MQVSVSKWFGTICGIGTEALARLGLRLDGFQLTLQSSQFDGVAFDPSRSRRMVWPLPK